MILMRSIGNGWDQMMQELRATSLEKETQLPMIVLSITKLALIQSLLSTITPSSGLESQSNG
jgi:hypothetical protein